MNDRFDPTKEWNQNILNNLKRDHPSACEGKTDVEILQAYDEFSMSDMSLTFTQWME